MKDIIKFIFVFILLLIGFLWGAHREAHEKPPPIVSIQWKQQVVVIDHVCLVQGLIVHADITAWCLEQRAPDIVHVK